jgi:formyltetrahydrofolate synthetase
VRRKISQFLKLVMALAYCPLSCFHLLMIMSGLPSNPAVKAIFTNENGEIDGLF